MELNGQYVEQELVGGRVGEIRKSNDTVLRPSGEQTEYIHKFLQFTIEQGCDFVPIPYGVNENKEERISYMPGDEYNFPLPAFFLDDAMIISASKLLLQFHDFSTKYIPTLTGKEQWLFPPVRPIEVMCHGDFAPYNVTIIDNTAKNIIDFDTLHPGYRMWDIAYAIYRWVPFTTDRYSGAEINLHEQIRRTKLFLNTYGVSTQNRCEFVDVVEKRLKHLTDFMQEEANNGNDKFQRDIEEGHLQLYFDDIQYFKDNEKLITEGII